MENSWLWGTVHPPIPTVQTTQSAIDLPELHKFVQECDTVALADCDNEGVHLPLLLGSLDLALWTSLFVTATIDPCRTVTNIKSAHAKPSDLLMQDEQETTKYVGICSMIEEALKLANNDALESNATRFLAEHVTATIGAANVAYPLLAKLKISSAEMSALEDFTDNINSSQAEKDKQTLVNTKGPPVHVKPPRCVELMVTYHHKCGSYCEVVQIV